MSRNRNPHVARLRQAGMPEAAEHIMSLEEGIRLCNTGGGKTFKPPEQEVREICDRLGYGYVMHAAARIWHAKNPVEALTVGPTASTVRRLLRECGDYPMPEPRIEEVPWEVFQEACRHINPDYVPEASVENTAD